MVRTKAILGFVAPFSFSGLKEDFSSKKKGEFVILGGGDVAFPLFLSASVATFHPAGALVISLFSCFGLVFSFYLFAFLGKGKAIPALPPIALFSVLGYLVFFLSQG